MQNRAAGVAGQGLAVVLLLLAVPLTNAQWWGTRPIIEGGAYGVECRISVQPNGYPAIMQRCFADNPLQCSWFDGVEWRTAEIENSQLVGYMDAVMHPSGLPAAVYLNSLYGGITYAWFDGVEWKFSVVDDGAYYARVRMDASNTPTVIYRVSDPRGITIATFDGTAWTKEPIEGITLDRLSSDFSAAFLPNGELAIAYFLSYMGEYDLRYMWRDGGQWQSNRIVEERVYSVDLRILPSGQPAIVYDNSAGVWYAEHDGAQWNPVVVDEGGSRPRLTVLPSGDPAISYHNDSVGDRLYYARRDGGVWQTTVVDDDGDFGLAIDIAALPNGSPGIAYFNGANGELRYAELVSDTWQTQIIAAPEHGGASLSMAELPTGQPAIACIRTVFSGPGELWYGWSDGTDWHLEPTGGIGRNEGTGLCILPDGTPLIAYQEDTFGDLVAASYDGRAWQHDIIDPNGEVGGSVSMTLLPSGHPTISYRNETNDELRNAWYDGASWQTAVLDAGPNAGHHTSIAILPNGQPAVAHDGGGWIKYTYHDGTEWTTELVAYAYSSGGWSDLAIAPSGEPAIAFVEVDKPYEEHELWYAERVNGEWTETSLGEGNLGWSPSLVFLLDGNPAISSQGNPTGLFYTWFEDGTWHQETLYPSGAPSPVERPWNDLMLSPTDQPRIAFYRRDYFGLWYAERYVTGDVNCDGSVDSNDASPFVRALLTPEIYAAQNPYCNRDLADIDGDGAISFADINPFVDLLLAD